MKQLIIGITLCIHVFLLQAAEPILEKTTSVTAGKQHDINLNLPGLHDNNEVIITPGGPYIESVLEFDKQIKGIAIKDARAFIASPKELLVVDLSNPARSLVNSRLNIGNNNTAITIFGVHALIVDDMRIHIIDANTLKPIGQYHANARITALAVSDQVVYLLLDGKQIVALQFNDIANPVELARIGLTHQASRLAAKGNQLYVAAKDHGLLIFEISNGLGLRQSGHYRLTGPALDVAVNNHTVYIANGSNGLTIFGPDDFGINNLDFKWQGSHQNLGNVHRVITGAQHVIAMNTQNEVYLLDVDNPQQPSVASSHVFKENINALQQASNHLYATTSSALLVVDAGGYTPQLSNEGLNFGQGVNYGGERRVFIRDNIAYVADWFSGIHIYDISMPKEPELISSYHTEGSPKGIVVRGDYAYVADDDHGLQILNIKDPRKPVKVSGLVTPGLAYTPLLVGDTLYLASHHGGFQIINISDVTTPMLIKHIDTPGKAWSIQVHNNIAYVADDDSGLLIFDIGTPDKSPELIAQFDPGGAAEDILINGDLAYVAFFDQGLYILDINDPAAPLQLGHVMTPGNARGMDHKADQIYIADWLAGIQVIDVGDPRAPRIIGSYDTQGAAWGVRIHQQYAYVMDWWGGFTVLDITQPERPDFAGRYHHRDTVMHIATKGHYAYVASGAAGLQVFDIDNPLNPTWITGASVGGTATGIDLEGDRAYLTLSEQAIAVVDISNPFQLKIIDTIKTLWAADHLKVSQDKIYLANKQHGLAIINANNRAVIAHHPGPVSDIWLDGNELSLATEKGVEIINTNNVKKPLVTKTYHTKHKTNLIRTDGNIFYMFQEGRGVEIVEKDALTLNHLSTIPLTVNVSDMQLINGTLFIVTETPEVLAVDVTEPARSKIKGRYPTLGNITRLEAGYPGFLYLAGGKTITAIKTLSDIAITTTRDNIDIKLPADMPLGSYDIHLISENNREMRIHNAITIEMPRFGKPKFSMEDLKKIMDSGQTIPGSSQAEDK